MDEQDKIESAASGEAASPALEDTPATSEGTPPPTVLGLDAPDPGKATTKREIAMERLRKAWAVPRSEYVKGGKHPNKNKHKSAKWRKHRTQVLAAQRGPWPGQEEIELLRDGCRRDFWTHFCWGFGAMANPKGARWIDHDVHHPLAEWFQGHVQEWMRDRKAGRVKQKHLAVVVHREVGKTTMISEAGQSWLHVLDPEISTFTGSEKTELAQKIMGAIGAIFDGSDPHSLFTQLYGNWSTSARKWTSKTITHAARKNTSRADPSLGTFAVETSITGAHPDAIFYDDPISYERLSTDSDWLKTVNDQVASMGYVLQGDGLMVYVGTRYDDSDHLGFAFKEEGIASISGMETDSMKTDPDGIWHVYFLTGRDPRKLSADHPLGEPTTPKVWPEERLRREQRKNSLRYAAQIMNDPQLSEFNPLTREQIVQCVVKPTDVPWSGMAFGICTDIAFSDGAKMVDKDETVMVVHGYPRNGSGDVYIIEGHGNSMWRGEDFFKMVVSTVQRYRRQTRRVIGISGETTRAGAKGSIRMNLANYFADANEPMPVYHEFERGGTKKIERLTAAANFWVDGHVRIIENCPGFSRIVEQMARIGTYAVNPRVKIDWADAHSDAFQPEFYQPMRRVGPSSAPWEKNAVAIAIPGLDQSMFEDGEDPVAVEGRPPI